MYNVLEKVGRNGSPVPFSAEVTDITGTQSLPHNTHSAVMTLALTHPVLCRADRCDPLSTSNRQVNVKYIPDVVNPGEIEEPI